jgi:hypothetical protein
MKASTKTKAKTKATSKALTKKSATKRAASKAPAPASASEGDEQREQIVFDRVREALPMPSEPLRAGLLRLATVERARKLGATTRATSIVKESRRSLLSVVDTIEKHGVALRYPPERLRFAMELVHQLERAIEQQASSQDGRRSVASQRARIEAEAKEAREELVDALEPIVSVDDNEKTAFDQARGNLRNGTPLEDSLDALVALGKRWLAHEDPALRALATMQNLSEALLHRAALAGRALRSARDATSLASGQAIVDSPQSNELEGRLLLELDALYDAIRRNRGTLGVALPVLGPDTRRALRWREVEAKTAGDEPPAG